MEASKFCVRKREKKCQEVEKNLSVKTEKIPFLLRLYCQNYSDYPEEPNFEQYINYLFHCDFLYLLFYLMCSLIQNCVIGEENGSLKVLCQKTREEKPKSRKENLKKVSLLRNSN